VTFYLISNYTKDVGKKDEVLKKLAVLISASKESIEINNREVTKRKDCCQSFEEM
jgi:hypothetical protein